MKDLTTSTVSRRDFLMAATTTAAAGASWAAAPPATQPAKPQLPTGILGKTKYPATLVSFGTVRLAERSDVRLVRQIIDSGVNLIHTSKSYTNGNSMQVMAEAFKAGRDYRERIMLCVKSFRPQEESEIDEILTILNIDHVDLLLPELHNATTDDLERIQQAQDNLKKKGKIRFSGFVCHGDLVGVTDMVLDKTPDFFDAALMGMALAIPADQHGSAERGNDQEADADQQKHFQQNIARLRKNGVGILSMKSGARQAVTQGYKAFGPHAKTVLAAGADTVLTSITTRDELEMIRRLDLSELKLSPDEQKAAQAFQRSRHSACRMCASCSNACPQGMPINDLMRIRMYHDEYGWSEHARTEFQLLKVKPEQWFTKCGDCTVCSQVCPVGMAHAREVRRVASLFA